MLPREYVANGRFHQLQWVMDTMIPLKKGDCHVSKATMICISLCIFFCLCLNSQNYREEMAIETALSVCHGPKHNSGLDLSPPFGKTSLPD